MNITIQVTASPNVKAFKNALPKTVQNITDKIGMFTLRQVKALTPKKAGGSGAAREGWKYTSSKGKFTLQNSVPYIGYLEDGTKAHAIRAVNAKALVWTKWRKAPVMPNWKVANAWAYKSVWHPGTKALHMMKKALVRAKTFASPLIENEFKKLSAKLRSA